MESIMTVFISTKDIDQDGAGRLPHNHYRESFAERVARNEREEAERRKEEQRRTRDAARLAEEQRREREAALRAEEQQREREAARCAEEYEEHLAAIEEERRNVGNWLWEYADETSKTKARALLKEVGGTSLLSELEPDYFGAVI